MTMLKLITVAILSLTLCGTAFAQLNPTVFEVYPNMAKVIFEAQTEGETLLRLPSGFEPSSVRILDRQGAATVKSFKVETGAGNFITPDHLLESKKDIDAISKKIDELSAKLSGLELSALILDNINADKIKPEELTAYIAKTSDLRAKAELEMKTLSKIINESKEKLKVLQTEYDKRIPADWNKTVNITVKTATKGKIYLEATTYKASWVPQYKMNLNTATGKISATLTAAVRQATGIKWNGTLILNTSTPTHRRTSTELPPLIANIFDPQPRPIPYEMKKVSPRNNMMATAELMQESAVATAPIYNETEVNYSYTVKASVSGDGANETIPLKTFTFDAKISYEAIPFIENKAFITALVASLPETILNSQATLYIDGDYSQDASLREYVKGSEFVAAFGLSAGISTSREPFIAKKDSSWRKGSLKDGYDIKVTNGTQKTHKVIVKDRMPVSADTKIKIIDIELTPKGSVDQNGICTWEIELKPNQTADIKVRYTVTHPTDAEIVINQMR